MQNDIGQLSHGYEKIIVSNNFSLLKMIQQVLNQIGKADLKITTFKSSDEFMRGMLVMRRNGLINSNIIIVCGLDIRRDPQKKALISNTYDEVYTLENHSKICLISNEKMKVAILTSQNQSYSYKFEFYYITTDEAKFDFLLQEFERVKKIAIKQNVLRERDTNGN